MNDWFDWLDSIILDAQNTLNALNDKKNFNDKENKIIRLSSCSHIKMYSNAKILFNNLSSVHPLRGDLKKQLNIYDNSLESYINLLAIITSIRDWEKSKMQTIDMQIAEFDVFLSHANNDKIDYVDELYSSLFKLGIKVFYDKTELSWGDNWKNRILEGTAKSEFSIIVISNNFFNREWTEKELNEFLQKQNESGQKIILPLLHNISFDDIKNHYPDLEYIQSVKTSDYTCDEIAILLAKELIKRYKYRDKV